LSDVSFLPHFFSVVIPTTFLSVIPAIPLLRHSGDPSSPSFRRRPESRKTSVAAVSGGAEREGLNLSCQMVSDPKHLLGLNLSCQMVSDPKHLLDSGLRRNDGVWVK